ncbi:hypothetical protein MPTK1_2g21720 [Marchantia polymorpha subsp. ruderalis]|uniref:Uncharacterized protein n=1 Tax=Marchantia polymorpha TaxID=3197 RepID=A0A2R6X2Q9_MARPO|nr:hypothetical protein MARPO_0040s0043 [Marchantia polymorpha]BBN03216.1 hypothetical protein Mp_2g21720 [Marchantia polymorpha subsp. ruderalis]|eukprot:PTQ40361.1 hypothetical protein MARPO_0040s0043 [Marchantia polymorpha]
MSLKYKDENVTRSHELLSLENEVLGRASQSSFQRWAFTRNAFARPWIFHEFDV